MPTGTHLCLAGGQVLAPSACQVTGDVTIPITRGASADRHRPCLHSCQQGFPCCSPIQGKKATGTQSYASPAIQVDAKA
jgi:hypothetical protein